MWTYAALSTLCLAVVVSRRVGNIDCKYTKYSEGTLVVIISVARGFSPCFKYLVLSGLVVQIEGLLSGRDVPFGEWVMG